MPRTYDTPHISLLYVEDEHEVRSLLTLTLELSYPELSILTAENGQEGLELFEQFRPDIVLTDLSMPVLDGIAMSAEIKKRVPETVIIALTACSDAHNLVAAIDLGINSYLLKPIDQAKLLSTITAYVNAITDAKRMALELQESHELLEQRVAERTLELSHTVALLQQENARRVQAEERMGLMAKVFEHSGEAIVITDSSNRILATNASFTRITGYHQEEVLGQEPRILKSGREAGSFYESMWETLLTNNYWQGELYGRRKQGDIFPKLLSLSVVRDSQGRIVNYIGNFTDISELKQAAQKIDYLAHHDVLTRLPNRISLKEKLATALEMAKQNDSHLAILSIDLDHFKCINDSLGHHMGDKLLSDVASRLAEGVRNFDIVARLGGDEYAVVLPQITSGTASAPIAGKIREDLSRTFHLENREVVITASIGISVFPHDGETAEELMKHADIAMHHAKATGRNNCQFFKREMNVVAQERFLLERNMRIALEQEEFLLHYQPQIDITTGRVIGVEALLRWQHPERGLIPPDTFIPLAEVTGLILPIGDWVLETACRQMLAWIAEGIPPLRMAVNLSAKQFEQETLPDTVRKIIVKTGLAPHLLELEITESAAMADPEATIRHLRKLRDMGVELAIDDFGTGYSSLSYLKLFPVNRLKIDRSFVKDLETDLDDAAIAAATIALAHKLGKEVVAEGVETEGQLSFLRDQQCDVIQGYLFSRPRSAGDISGYLRERC